MVLIMRPDREVPGVAADEVCMVIGDGQVVNGFIFARVEKVFDWSPLAVMT